MAHHKHHEKLNKIKEVIKNSKNLSEEEKNNALSHIEEWYKEDKGFGLLIDELLNISKNIEPILDELGIL